MRKLHQALVRKMGLSRRIGLVTLVSDGCIVTSPLAYLPITYIVAIANYTLLVKRAMITGSHPEQ